MAVTINPLALTSLATMKTIAGISVGDTSKDDQLTLAINAATAGIERYCNRVFGRTIVSQERQAIKGGPRVVVNRPPINGAVTAIAFEDSQSVLDSVNYLVERANGGVIYVKTGIPRWGMRRWGIAQDVQPGSEPPTLLVSYDGGYITRQQSVDSESGYFGQAPTLPGDIESACLKYAVDFYKDTASGSADIQSEALGDASVTYRDDGVGADPSAPSLPKKIAGLVKAYKRIVFV